MQELKKKEVSTPDSRAHEVTDLLQQALQQPGVRELMEVYEQWQRRDEATRPYLQALGVKRIISASNTSRPVA